ncbi:MAG: Thymidylate kinase [Vezdaea aestivalis]|nr:MAG: Thymidylate kinase [Vezdaea aestivalis]
MSGPPGRGVLIAVEGLDRAGKSTQCQNLLAHLRSRGLSAELIRFPDRTTPTGQLIDSFLKNEIEIPPRSIHLLFSANRWEVASRIEELINSGTSVVLDRYIPSGIVYSLSKDPRPFGLDWAIAAEVGLPAPDVVLLLTIDERVAEMRGGFGAERFEKKETQRRVKEAFMELKEWWVKNVADAWCVIDGGQEIREVKDDIIGIVDLMMIRWTNPKLQRIKAPPS